MNRDGSTVSQQSPSAGKQRDGNGFANDCIRLPSPDALFRKRAERIRQLADERPALSGFLLLMADLAEAQQSLSDQLERTLPFDLPYLANADSSPDVQRWLDEAHWHDSLRYLVGTLKGRGGEAVRKITGRIDSAANHQLDDWAAGFLSLDNRRMDPGTSPLIAAALQVHWTWMAVRTDLRTIRGRESGYLCPVCGFTPVAGVLRNDSAVPGLRYLCCSLCASEWNRVRIRCVVCGATQDIAYFGLEGTGGAIKAEACRECNTYIKVMDREKDPMLDPFADDLATVALDILMAEQGFERLGLNPYLVPGRPQ